MGRCPFALFQMIEGILHLVNLGEIYSRCLSSFGLIKIKYGRISYLYNKNIKNHSEGVFQNCTYVR